MSAQAGTIVVSTASLPTFGNCAIYFVSDAQRYTVSGSGLNQNLAINAPEHFEISLNYNYGYASKIELIPNVGSINSTNIYVRFSPYLSGAKSGNISHISAGSATQTKAVLGNATATPATGTNAASYYNTIGTSATGNTLKTALYNKILGHTVTSYGSGSSGLWATYSTTDPFYNGKVWDIYSTKLDASSPYEFTFSTNQCGSYSVEGDCYNREHSFPQSWFAQASPMVSDMFHIYPTDGKVNGMRNNYPFGEVSTPTFTSLQGSKLGANITPGYTAVTFEPINDYKGDLARSYFYMATRYHNLIASWQNNGNANDVLDGTAFPAYDAWFLNLLVKWHNQDPPTAKEINRNNAIYGYQNNRNPFVDSPQYVNRIWGLASSLEPTLAPSAFAIKSNTTTTAILTWKSGNGQRRLVLARAGAPVNAVPLDSFTYIGNNTFGLGTQLGVGNYVVYNGMGSSIEINGLNPSLAYHFLVVEYNGYGAASNYLSSAALASGAISVPVTWLNFEANLISQEQVNLHWKTTQEKNNAYFLVERNVGKAYVEIGKVAATKKQSAVNRYAFSDLSIGAENVLDAVIQYRLKQVDIDGHYTYSKEIFVTLAQEYPIEINVVNPIGNGLMMLCKQADTPVEIKVMDASGKLIFETKTNLNHETFIPLNMELSTGLYFLHIVHRAGQQTFKIIKP
ncbi:MAG: endonuclease [bacterium]|nr:endonuclease [bacterium]